MKFPFEMVHFFGGDMLIFVGGGGILRNGYMTPWTFFLKWLMLALSRGSKFNIYMDVSENSGTPKSSILIGFSNINRPFWGTPIFGNTHMAIIWKESFKICC